MPAVPATRSRRDRAARRRTPGPPDRRPAPVLAPVTGRQVARVVWILAMAALFVFTAVVIVRKITWYLAVDQYGYLTFAHDLLHGRVFHHWPPLDAFAARIPSRVDTLSQTYIYDQGRLYCRYAPGFAIILAAWLGIFGDDGAHYLNPTMYLMLLAVALAFQVRLFRSRWRALAGTALIALAPTQMYLWALTLVRELPTHTSALLGLFLLLPARGRRLGPARTAAAGLALGWAGSIRPDALLYLGPGVCLMAARWWHERTSGWRFLLHALLTSVAIGVPIAVLATTVSWWVGTVEGARPLLVIVGLGGLGWTTFVLTTGRWRESAVGWHDLLRTVGAGVIGVTLGLAPFFSYNWLATGNPFRPTQGMEIENFLPTAPAPEPAADATPAGGSMQARVGFPPPAPAGAWIGGTSNAVQGGGLKLSNLPEVLPSEIDLVWRCYGTLLLGVALWGAAIALVRRRLLLLAGLPYCILAILFYSCWAKSDARYLVGVFLFVPMFVVEGMFGTLDLVRLLQRTGNEGAARVLASGFGVLLLGGALLLQVPGTVAMLIAARDATGQYPAALPPVVTLLAAVGATGSLAAAVWPARRVARFAAPAFALALVAVACTRNAQGAQTRAKFQRPEMLKARAAFNRVVEPGAVVLTLEEIGRPAENIDYYSGTAHAFYLTDLMRWRIPIAQSADLLLRGGFKPYLFINKDHPGRAGLIHWLGGAFQVDLVADIPPDQSLYYFVAAAFHGGLRMHLYRLTPRGSTPPAARTR